MWSLAWPWVLLGTAVADTGQPLLAGNIEPAGCGTESTQLGRFRGIGGPLARGAIA